jgi:hypothetical protein
MSRFITLLVSLCALALIVPGVAGAKAKKKKEKHVVKTKIELEAGQALRVDIGSDLATCADYDCWLWIAESKDESLYLIEVAGDGSWIAYSKEEEDEEEDEEKEEESDEEAEAVFIEGETGVKVAVEKLPEEDCDKIKLKVEEEDEEKADEDEEAAEAPAEKAEETPDWMDLPVLTLEQREKCARKTGPAGKYTVEKVTGAVDGADADRHLLVPAELLPAGDFEVSTNGYWGAVLDGQPVGSASKTGVVKVLR